MLSDADGLDTTDSELKKHPNRIERSSMFIGQITWINQQEAEKNNNEFKVEHSKLNMKILKNGIY